MTRFRSSFHVEQIHRFARLQITNTNLLHRRIIRKAARWFGSALLSKRLLKNIELTIYMNRTMPDKGECECLDDNVAPRRFAIYLSTKQTIFCQLITLAHEIVHLKQFATNQLFDYANDNNLTRWNKSIINVNDFAYRDLPWEKEAYKLQRPLTRSYKQWLKENEIPLE